MSMGPLAIIGDVHGDVQRLESLLAHPSLAGRRLIFVGDLVNRGPCTKNVLEIVCAIVQTRPDTLVLKGNHEVALLEYLSTGDDNKLVTFLAMGGAPTILSYVGIARGDVYRQFTDVFPASHRELVASALDYWETPDLLVSHSGVSPSSPGSRLLTVMAGSNPGMFEAETLLEKLVICGHYVQSSGKPYVSGKLICVDTGCGTSGGALTALLLPERTFIQS